MLILLKKYVVGKVVETIKRNISKTLSRKYNLLKKAYWDNKGIWVKGYFVSTLYCRLG